MYIYILLLLIAIFFTYYENDKNKATNSFIIMFLMLAICGLRDKSVGIDTFRYIDIFTDKIFLTFDTGETLFFSTYILIDKLGVSENLWLLFISSLIYVPLFFAVKANSPLPALSMLIFMISTSSFFPESMNIIRQTISIVFLLIAYTNWNKEKKTLTFLNIIIATFFHMSSLVALPYLLLKDVKFSKATIILTLFIALIVGVTQTGTFINELISGINMLFKDSNPYTENLIKYSMYAEKGSLMNWKGIAFKTLPLIVLCLITMPNNNTGLKYHFYYNIMFVSTIIYCFLSSVPFGFRIIFGQMIIQVLVIPLAFIYGTPKQRFLLKLYILTLIILYILYLYNISQQTSTINNIIPYKFFFN